MEVFDSSSAWPILALNFYYLEIATDEIKILFDIITSKCDGLFSNDTLTDLSFTFMSSEIPEIKQYKFNMM